MTGHKRITPRQKQISGFTLIELVAVIVILGILGTATAKFLIFGTQVYVESTSRQSTLSQARFVVERLTREIRDSIPNSIRITADKRCVEFIPIKASGTYRTDFAATSTASFAPQSGSEADVISFNGNYETGDRLYIYALKANHLYRDTDRYSVIDNVTGTAPELTVEFTASESFAQQSPIERYYTADHSVIYCINNNNLYRLKINTIRAGQRDYYTVSLLGVLMAEGIANTLPAESPFNYSSGVLYRNSVFNLYLEFAANQNENMFFNQEVHIPNVP